MDYFVNINNNPYHRWQTELLIESFQHHGLQDNLCIATTEGNEPQYADYSKNLRDHARKLVHENYKELNDIYSLIIAIDNDVIREPFVLLKPHMVLVQPVSEGPESVIYNTHDKMDIELRNEVQTLLGREIDPPIHPGDAFVFKNCPNRFFHKVALWLQDPRKPSELAAWTTTLYEYFGLMTYRTTHLEMPMIYEDLSFPLINYKYGYPPHFHKMNYHFDQPIQFATDPLKEILKIEMSPPPTEYMQQLIQQYLKK